MTVAAIWKGVKVTDVEVGQGEIYGRQAYAKR